MRFFPSNALVFPHQLWGMCQIRIFVADVRVNMMTNDVLMIPHGRTRNERHQVGQVGIDAPVTAETEMQGIMPVIANGQPAQDRGDNQEYPLT
mmetsp:Transcript_22231/g.45313  ORF Transcript_22231/g.45313 Transcript_22231/m.45313 type:complete len:93 (+) Transcript_22231:641-919(+)